MFTFRRDAATARSARRKTLFLGFWRTSISIITAIFCVLPGGGAFAQADKKEDSRLAPRTEPKHTNRLIHATSPYLLQHAHNPVDWYQWGEDAFAQAKKEDKPVFLSIGYAACHWCHVMEHESFESEEVAAVLNRDFICIKVDREERPDIDEIYMAFTQQATGGGGWPMSVWLTPEGVPFHAGTYYPKEPFMQVLGSIADAWRNDRERITTGADGAKEFFDAWAAGSGRADAALPRKTVDETATLLSRYFDRSRGGISGGRDNKFPPTMAMDLMLRVYRRTGDSDLFEAVDVTLDHMARGGIYDHIGGGICRYSTDRDWLVPHFEKMLYDQALVSSIYLDAYQVTRNPRYAAVAADIFDYVVADLQSPEGGFFSSRDADSEGLEGAYYIWTVEQIHELLGEKEGKLFCAYYDVSASGNWFERLGHAPKGPKNVLHISKPPAAFAKIHNLDVADLTERIRSWRKILLLARAKRTPPALDDKILTAWNGLMIASLAKGARVLNEPKYAVAAGRAARFILDGMRADGRLLRSYRDGKAHLAAYLSDYAFLVEGLLNLYEATFDRRWLDEATALADAAVKYYYDQKNGAFFFTAADAETLIARSKSPRDGAIPSGNSVMAMSLLRLAVLLDRKDYRTRAESIFQAFAGEVEASPTSFDRLLCALDFFHDRVREIAIIGDPNSQDTAALIRTVYDRYLPNKVVVHAPGGGRDTDIPLLVGKVRKDGRATAYVCRNYTCKLPVTTPQALAKQLDDK